MYRKFAVMIWEHDVQISGLFLASASTYTQ